MTNLEQFIEDMKFIERNDDDPNIELIMELARAIQADLTPRIAKVKTLATKQGKE